MIPISTGVRAGWTRQKPCLRPCRQLYRAGLTNLPDHGENGKKAICKHSTQALTQQWKRYSSSFPGSNIDPRGEKLRVAIVGGGCAGLAAALHLAPLVEEGFIASPIDIYDASASDKNHGGRDIGVGLWTTALDAFGNSTRAIHQSVYQDLTQNQKISTWLDHVGYRTPNGSWLMKSKLPATWKEHSETKFPGLLFMRERDLLDTLLKAVLWEQQLGTLMIHRTKLGSCVVGVAHDEWWSRGQMQHPWSAKLELQMSTSKTENSERDYHLIVAADGTQSMLRSKYGGHTMMSSSVSAGTLGGPSMDDSFSPTSSFNWDEANHQQAVGLQDRNYTVFRGNSPITTQELNALDPRGKLDYSHHISFQTWGTGKSMRFATVPMFCPLSSRATNTSDEWKQQPSEAANKHVEHQVWFITVDDKDIEQESDPSKRVDLLLDHFKDWHAPIQDIVRATDPQSILMERAIAHRHCMDPVVNLNRVLQKQKHQRDSAVSSTASTTTLSGKGSPNFPYAGGPGPALVFLGDAYMTVDPILAQGFTVAMEGSAILYGSVRKALQSQNSAFPPPLAFDPYGACLHGMEDFLDACMEWKTTSLDASLFC